MLVSMLFLALTQAAPAAATQAAPADSAEKQICKRYAPVGSNIASKKQCMTKRQWDETAREAQAFKRLTEPALTTVNQ